MNKALRTTRTFRKTWDSDKAIKGTYNGLFGKYQLRAYLLVVLGYGIVAAGLAEMPTFACKYFLVFRLNLFLQSNLQYYHRNISIVHHIM